MIEGITLAPAVTGRVLLDAAAYLTWGVTGEFDDMKGIQDAGGVLELVIDGVLVSLEGIQCRDLDTGAEVFAALGQSVLMHGDRSAWDQVQRAGRGVILPSCQVYDAGEFTWAPAASVLVVPYVLINSQYLHACEPGGVIRCGLQARLDVGPHGIPRGCPLSSQSCNGGSLQSAHTQGTQQGNHRTLCRAPEHLGCEPRSSDGSPPNRRADHTDHNDQATQSSSR